MRGDVRCSHRRRRGKARLLSGTERRAPRHSRQRVAVAAEAPEHRRHSGLQRGRGPRRIGHDASRTWNEEWVFTVVNFFTRIIVGEPAQVPNVTSQMTTQDKTTQDYTTGGLHQTEGNTKTTSGL